VRELISLSLVFDVLTLYRYCARAEIL